MTENNVIVAEKLTKIYKLYNSPLDRLIESVNPFATKRHHDFIALNNVDFSIAKGSAFGIIGKNGSGKSTLLKILAGVLTPNHGTVQINGKVSALLELGTAFNPELTGIENVYFNGTLSGQSKAEIDEKLESILAFADIGSYVNQPVKTYSSGMFVRLAFAVTTTIEPDILIIDEAFSVGDIFFQQKCYRRLDELREKGVTILLVTHSMTDIVQYCGRTLLLDHGNAVFCGKSDEAVKRYFLLEQGNVSSKQMSDKISVIENSDSYFLNSDGFWPDSTALLDLSKVVAVSSGVAKCTALSICDEAGQQCAIFTQGATASFYYEFELLEDIEVPIGGLIIRNDRNVLVHGKSTLEYGSDVPKRVHTGELVRFRQDILLNIATGVYTFNVGLGSIANSDFIMRGYMAYPVLMAKTERLCHLTNAGSFTVGGPPVGSAVRFLHHGVCDLPGKCTVTLINTKQDSGRIVVVEYPKSGGSWLVNILGHILGLPKRDIYVNSSEPNRFINVSKHPWYSKAESHDIADGCIIKSHELPTSPLHNFPAKFIHLVRDGRDVVVSKYFFEKEFCVKNNLIDSFDFSFGEFLEKTAKEWAEYLNAYNSTDVVTVKYEQLLLDPVGTVSDLLTQIGCSVTESKISAAVQAYTKDNMKKELDGVYAENTFVRKGISGDWLNYFDADNKVRFSHFAGETLITFGYERNNSWLENK